MYSLYTAVLRAGHPCTHKKILVFRGTHKNTHMANKKLRVGVLMGGQSSERPISLKTGRAICQALTRRAYRVIPIDVGPSLPKQLREKKVEVAFLALHGPGGEDGTVQGLLEVMGIPYTGSGVLACAIAQDKAISKAVLQVNGIPVPQGVVLQRCDSRQHPPARLKFPLVIKPCSEGSSIGVSIVRNRSNWQPALRHAYEYGDRAIVESFIDGREIAIGVFNGKPMPPVEIVAPGGFYDFAAKYEKAETQYLCPAPLTGAAMKQLQDLAIHTYAVIGCEGAARVDFRLSRRGRPAVLEINPIPGMTERSLLPMAAAKAKMSYDTLVERILGCAIRSRRSKQGAFSSVPKRRFAS